MVNRAKRKIASDLIERLLAGEITNDDFDAAFPRDKDDPALGAIYERLWFYWDDRRTHTLTGKDALDDAARALFERCRAFLDSDLEYEWPLKLSVAPLSLFLLRALRLRKAAERREREAEERIRSIGDADAWPFLRAQDLRRV
jgi:hypothetical protein